MLNVELGSAVSVGYELRQPEPVTATTVSTSERKLLVFSPIVDRY
jgi:hypothetical protein